MGASSEIGEASTEYESDQEIDFQMDFEEKTMLHNANVYVHNQYEAFIQDKSKNIRNV